MDQDRLLVYRARRHLYHRPMWRWDLYDGGSGRKLALCGEEYGNLSDLLDNLAVVVGVSRENLFDFERPADDQDRRCSAVIVRRTGRRLQVVIVQ